MTIEEVIRECVTALYIDQALNPAIVLKGGTALHLSENLHNRMSTDMDFSVPGEIDSPNVFFKQMTRALNGHFKGLGFEVIDGEPIKKPKIRKPGLPEFWSGWSYSFKLCDLANKKENSRTKTRRALIPTGAAGSKIKIEISENEYCGLLEIVKIGGAEVSVYSGELLILEKIRAICQQHPEYPYVNAKNRARDYYDIFQLFKKHRSKKAFYKKLRENLQPVFQAKDVSLNLLDAIFSDKFVARNNAGFLVLRDTVKGELESFGFYNEQLKFLISKIHP